MEVSPQCGGRMVKKTLDGIGGSNCVENVGVHSTSSQWGEGSQIGRWGGGAFPKPNRILLVMAK